jgi:Flp pilus assembly protein TadB
MTNVIPGRWTLSDDAGSRVADAPEPAYDEPMTQITRPELDAKLETIEARMDGRVAAIQASLDGYASRMEERALRTDDRFKRIEESLQDTQSAISSLKSTTIVTAIGAVLTIVLGVAAFNATVLSNMVASFESGKNTSMAQQEVKRQSEETAALLKQIQQQVSGQPKSVQSSPVAK